MVAGTDMMDLADTFDHFLANLLPHGASADLRAHLQPAARVLRVATGDSADLLQDAAYYVWIARGTAKLVAHGAGKQRQVVEFYLAGDLALVPARHAHAYWLDAIKPCELLALPAAALHDAARGNGDLALALLERMAADLARSRGLSLTLGRKRTMERVAAFLLSVRHRLCMAGGADKPFVLPMSRLDIGDHLAITVESISREVVQLRMERLIATPVRATIAILDPPRLAKRAGFLAGAA